MSNQVWIAAGKQSFLLEAFQIGDKSLFEKQPEKLLVLATGSKIQICLCLRSAGGLNYLCLALPLLVLCLFKVNDNYEHIAHKG